MRPSASASIGVVSELMNVHATLGRRVAALDVIADGSWCRFRRLFEGDGSADVGVTTENRNYRAREISYRISA